MSDTFDYDFDPSDLDREYYGLQPVICKRCKAQVDGWHHSGMRWLLMEANGKPHVCDVTDEFADLDA